MADSGVNKRLGRGLAALIGEMDQPATAREEPTKPDNTVAIESIRTNPNNPRRLFAEDELNDLANSIREHGIVQPILVRTPSGPDAGFEIIAGERRWRAAQLAKLHRVPVIIREVADKQALEIAIIENVQRTDLNPIEEAHGYQQLIDDHAYLQTDLAQVIGKSRSHVANTLRLLKLPKKVRTMVSGGALSAGHARALVTAENSVALAEKIVRDGLSVRQVEAIMHNDSKVESKRAAAVAVPTKDADTLALERSLGDLLGLKVAVSFKKDGTGNVRIYYKSLEQLDDICRRLQH